MLFTNDGTSFSLCNLQIKIEAMFSSESLKKIFVLTCVVTSVSSCSSYFKRKDCEAEHWYDYGYAVAMRGERPSSDAKVVECRKVGAEIDEGQLDVGFKSGMENYCKPETIFVIGKNGQFFNTDLCDPQQAPSLKLTHQKGVREFCAKDHAASVGASGTIYNSICPPDLEKAFLPEYRKGRKSFLQARIKNDSEKVSQIGHETEELLQNRSQLSSEYSALLGHRVLKVDKVKDPRSGEWISKEEWVEDPFVASRRSSLNGDMDQVDRQLTQKRKERDQLNEEISKDRLEEQTL